MSEHVTLLSCHLSPYSMRVHKFFCHCLTYLLTPWCRVLLEQLTGLQLVKKFPAFHGTRRFITALTSVRHVSLSWASPIQSIYPHSTSFKIHPNVIHPSTPRSHQRSLSGIQKCFLGYPKLNILLYPKVTADRMDSHKTEIIGTAALCLRTYLNLCCEETKLKEVF